MKKAISLLLVTVFLFGLVGCGLGSNAAEPTLSAEDQMKQDYLDQLQRDHDYTLEDVKIDSYGVYNGCHVAFVETLDLAYSTALTFDYLGEYTFKYPTSRKLTAYKDGQFMGLEDAYEAGWLTMEDVSQVFEKYRERYPGLYVDYWMKVHYLEQFEKNGKYTVDDVRIESYGMCGDCRVAFVDTTDMAYLAVLTEENIAGYSFRYTSSRTLKVYKDGEYKSLQEAYDAGWFDTSSLGLFFVSYRDAHPSYYEEDNWA